MPHQDSATPSATTPLSTSAHGSRFAGLAFGFLGIAAFSLSLPMTKLALNGFPPLFLGAGRAVGATLIAAAVLAVTRQRFPRGRQWARLAVVALGVVVGFPFLTSFGLQYVPAAHGAVMIGLLPAATAVVAVIRNGERPSPVFWVAAALGAVSVGAFAVLTHGTTSGPAAGDLFLLGAVVLASIGYAEGGMLARELGAWQTISWALVVSFPAMLPLAIGSVADLDWSSVPGIAWLGLGYVTVISMYLGFFAWYRGLAIGPMATVSQIQLAQPVLTILWSALFFGEEITPLIWVAAAVVIAFAGTAVRARVRVRAPERMPERS